MHRFVGWLCLVSGLLGSAVGARGDVTDSWPEASPAILREEIFGVRYHTTLRYRGAKEAEKMLRDEMRKRPAALEVRAYVAIASLLLARNEQPTILPLPAAIAQLRATAAEGSVAAKSVLGLALLSGANGAVEIDESEGARLLREAAESGDADAMAFYGLNLARSGAMAQGALLVRRAAARGSMHGLIAMADGFETGAFGVKSAAVAMLYYAELANYGMKLGWQKLAEYESKGVPGAALERALAHVRFVHDGGWFAAPTVQQHLATLEKIGTFDPRAQTEIGIAYLEGEHVKRDVARARQLFESAAQAGNADAQFFLAYMRMRELAGLTGRDVGLREMTALADAGNPRAAARLGNYFFFGAYEAKGFKKDAAKAFHYSRLAAAAGSFQGVCDLAKCYEHGIGTKENYALAAKVYYVAGQQAMSNAREKIERHLAFAQVP